MSFSVRDGGVWKEGEPYVRDGGLWKPVTNAWVRDSGVWKEFYSSAIEFVGADYASGDTVTIPPHNPGDLVLLLTGRQSTSPTTTPAGWEYHGHVGRTSGAPQFLNRSLSYFSLISDGLISSVASANAYNITCLVFRNASGIGNISTWDQYGSTSTATLSAIPSLSSGSWVVGSDYSSNMDEDPPQMVRATAGTAMAAHTNGPVETFAARTFSRKSSALNISATLEVLL